MNVAGQPGERNASLARIEAPEWIVRDEPARLEAALAAVWSDCRLLDYPYLLTRAHELALVSRQERTSLRADAAHRDDAPRLRVEELPKANTKRFVGGR